MRDGSSSSPYLRRWNGDSLLRWVTIPPWPFALNACRRGCNSALHNVYFQPFFCMYLYEWTEHWREGSIGNETHNALENLDVLGGALHRIHTSCLMSRMILHDERMWRVRLKFTEFLWSGDHLVWKSLQTSFDFLNNLNDFLNLCAGTNVSRLISTLKNEKSAITLVPSVHVVTEAQLSKIS